jgi:acyl-CoA thioester hydrolase
MCSRSYESGRTERAVCKGSCRRPTGSRLAGGKPESGARGRRRAEGSARRARVAHIGRRHTHRLRVRYGECDPQGVVFNAHYFAYFDIALTELWREAAGGYAAMMEDGLDLQVVEATARYKAPARFDDELDIEIEVTHLGTTSMVTDLAIRRGGELLVEGRLAHVFVDTENHAKTPIPDQLRSALA